VTQIKKYLCEGKKKINRKISGSGTTVKGKRPYYDVMNFSEHTCKVNYGNVPETSTATEVSFTSPDETEMGNSQLGENIIHGQKTEGGSSKKEQ
jgi:hypothetical protein